ncbi:MAG TPA: helicase-related protein [Caulobacterales bacterium]|nr:helicase-related protein [Caulobacterales bacterium]
MAARALGRVKAVLGPTNTGKTHLAIERMLAHGSGMIGLPLRLLAREVYDRAVKLKGAGQVALITGEEKIAPDTAKYFVCTVEAMPLDRIVEFVGIDEIQVAQDPDRGHIFADRILHARGHGETMLMGSDTMRPMLKRLLPDAEIIRRERLSSLAYAGVKKITKLPKRSAVVAFSAEEVYAIAELLRRHRGGAAVVMGALSPRTRNAQVALYQSGEVDFLVATDAIGMGLNMDVDHVAFASRRKFDGRRWRDLRADEIAQIAGRAGRFKTDGAFGETAECAPFDEETIERVEEHEFEAVDAITWRTATLRLESIAALIASLETPPAAPGLMRVRGADDEEALKIVGAEAEVADLVRSRRDVERLWEACQLPDFRKASTEEHARLVGQIALHLLSPKRRIPRAWIAREVEALDRSEGDLDVLQQRLAQVRTWTYVANRADWLDDLEEFRDRTRAIEDKLSDALHAALTQRFIDRRTSALLKGLKREDALLAGVSHEGEVTVEGHYVGRLDGLDFKPDPRALDLEGRAVRNAALRALRPEISRRLRAVAEARDEELELGRDGRIRILGPPASRQRKGSDAENPAGEDAGGPRSVGAPIARLEQGGSLLRPRVTLIGADTAPAPERDAARERLQFWLAGAVAHELGPLMALEAAWREGRLPAAARGLAFRLVENAGALDRAGQGVDELPPEARGALAQLGVRIGRHSIYMPALGRPQAARLAAILQHWALPDPHGALFLPRVGAPSANLERARTWAECAAAGYRPFGKFAVRFDRLERLAAALKRAKGEGRDTPLEPHLAKIIGRPARDLPRVLTALGYQCVHEPGVEGPSRWRLPAEAKPRPPRREPDGPFAALAELLPAKKRKGRKA